MASHQAATKRYQEAHSLTPHPRYQQPVHPSTAPALLACHRNIGC